MTDSQEFERSVDEINWQEKPLDLGQPDARLWSGRISAKPESLTDLDKSMAEYLAAAGDYYYAVSPQAAERCIDGRPSRRAIDSGRQDLLSELLGPQMPGGSPAVALSHRLAELNPGDWERTDIAQDMSDLARLYDELGLPVSAGSHDDEHAVSPDTGCGAIDKMPEIIYRLSETSALPYVHHYVKAITAKDFDEAEFRVVIRRFRELLQPEAQEKYLLYQDNEYMYKHLTLEVLRDEDLVGKNAAVETMHSPHRELALVVNKVSGSTFHRDLFCHDTDNRAQIFNYDYWHSLERAKAVYTDDQPNKRRRFLLARAAYAVGTAMVLTDGSLAVGIRT